MLCFLKQGITLSANAWTNAGHGLNQVYDLLHMMGRDDISVGVGGEGGILDDGTILPDGGGYLPIIDQVLLLSPSFSQSISYASCYHSIMNMFLNEGIHLPSLYKTKKLCFW